MENLQVMEATTVETGGRALRVVPLHRHESYSLGVAVSGAHRMMCRRTTVVVGPGVIVAFNPGEYHSGLPACEKGWSYCMLHFDERLISRFESEFGLRSPPAFGRTCFDDGEIALRIINFCSQAGAVRSRLEREIEAYSLIRNVLIGSPACSTERRNCHEHAAVERVSEYLRANFASPCGLYELGKIAGLHPNYLLAVFTRQTGVSPQRFLNQIRVAVAQELISSGESLSIASLSVGYCDQSHLNRNFRKLVGVTPGVFRSGLRGLTDERASSGRSPPRG